MRTLIVDDHPLFSEGLRLLLAGVVPVAEAVCCESGERALQIATERGFDLVLLDWNMGAEPSGSTLLGEMKAAAPQARVVIVSGESSAERICEAIDAGAVGFVPKESSPALLIAALSVIAQGGVYLPVEVLVPRSAPQAPGSECAGRNSARSGSALRGLHEAFPALTPRHVDVLERMARGLPNKQIARELDISDGTVKQHLNAIFRELGVQNRTGAVYLLARSGVRFD